MQAVLDRAAKIRLAAFDVDGVLTDGGLFLGENGDEYRRFDVQDGLGLVLLRESGCEVAVVSARDSAAVSDRMAALGIHHVSQGRSDKGVALREIMDRLNVAAAAVSFAGDDVLDLPAMNIAGLAIAVANAHTLVRERAHWTTSRPGGAGAVREICELLLRARGLLDRTYNRYQES